MDITTVLEAARSPLSLSEIKTFCGPVWDGERFDFLLKSGEIGKIPGTDDVFWRIPPALRKRAPQSRKINSPQTSNQRASDIHKVVELHNKILTVAAEFEALKGENSDIPSEAQVKKHIERLHKLNETRDEGVKIIEKIAALDETSVHKVYERFDISEEMLK